MCTKRPDPSPPIARSLLRRGLLRHLKQSPAELLQLLKWPEAELPTVLVVMLFEKEALNVSHWRHRAS